VASGAKLRAGDSPLRADTEPPPATLRDIRAQDGARLEYEVLGEGPPLVLLHGYFAGRRAFARQRAALGTRFRLVLPSARGHEGSDATLPFAYGAGTSDVDDVAAVLDAEGITRTDLIAHSSGGATALVFALRHGSRVRRLVLIEPTLLPLVPPAEADAAMAGIAQAISAEATTGPLACMRAILAVLGAAAWARLDAAAQDARVAALAALAPLTAPHFRSLMALPVRKADLAGFAAPARFVYGAASYPFEQAIARVIAATRPDLAPTTLPGAGHNVHRDQADAFNALTLEFLAPK
jgi:pimeloyl-ACP methyl ester carboxylesterase